MRPWFEAIFSMYCGRKALAPLVTREMRRHILDSILMDKIGIGASIFCNKTEKD